MTDRPDWLMLSFVRYRNSPVTQSLRLLSRQELLCWRIVELERPHFWRVVYYLKPGAPGWGQKYYREFSSRNKTYTRQFRTLEHKQFYLLNNTYVCRPEEKSIFCVQVYLYNVSWRWFNWSKLRLKFKPPLFVTPPP